jgi:hypothetical protein
MMLAFSERIMRLEVKPNFAAAHQFGIG